LSRSELKVLLKVRRDMLKACDRDGINKVYRQARIWNRYHHFFAEACSYEKYSYINRKFKAYRHEALGALR
jgi:hypothetical protein